MKHRPYPVQKDLHSRSATFRYFTPQGKDECFNILSSNIRAFWFFKNLIQGLLVHKSIVSYIDINLDPSVKRGFLHEPFGPKGITKKPRRTQRVRLRFFATFCLQSIRTEIPRLTDGSRIKSSASATFQF